MKEKGLLIYALIPAAFWGVSFVATKLAVLEIPPFTLGFVRFLISYAVLRVVLLLRGNRKNLTASKTDRKILMLMGLLGITLYFVFENFGLIYTSASNSSLIISTIPIFTLLYDRIFRKEKISGMVLAGIIIGFAGLYILINGFSLKVNINVKGDIMMFFSVFSWLAYTIFSKKLKNRYSSINITADMSLYGSIFFVPFVIFEALQGKFSHLHTLSIASFASILYLGIICSALAYILWNKALAGYDGKKVNSFIYIIPVFTIAAESVQNMTIPDIRTIFASSLIITGLFIANSRENATKM